MKVSERLSGHDYMILAKLAPQVCLMHVETEAAAMCAMHVVKSLITAACRLGI